MAPKRVAPHPDDVVRLGVAHLLVDPAKALRVIGEGETG